MKKVTLAVILIGLSLLSMKKAYYDVKKSTAEVEQMQGLYIFTDSKPVAEYEYLGTVKLSLGLGSGQYQNVRNVLIKRAKKEYPQSDAIILLLKDGGTDRADVIKFKE